MSTPLLSRNISVIQFCGLPMVWLLRYLLLGAASGFVGAWDSVAVARLKSSFQHEPSTRPDPITLVHLQLALQAVQRFDTQAQEVSIYTWWRSYWYDHRLVWEPSEYNGTRYIHLDSQDLWTPDLIFWQGLETMSSVGLEHGPPSSRTTMFVLVESDGKVTMGFPLTVKFWCPVKLNNFPWDTQECTVDVGPWLTTGCEQDVLPYLVSGSYITVDNATESKPEDWEPVELRKFVQNHEMRLRKVVTELVSEVWPCCEDPFAFLKIKLTFSRDSLPYLYSVIIPLFLITAVGVFSLLTHPESGERLGLCVTVLLATVAVQWITTDMVPKIGQWMALSRMAIVCLTLNSVIILETIAVQYLVISAGKAAEHRTEQWGPGPVMWILDSHLMKKVLQRPPPSDNNVATKDEMSSTTSSWDGNAERKGNTDENSSAEKGEQEVIPTGGTIGRRKRTFKVRGASENSSSNSSREGEVASPHIGDPCWDNSTKSGGDLPGSRLKNSNGITSMLSLSRRRKGFPGGVGARGTLSLRHLKGVGGGHQVDTEALVKYRNHLMRTASHLDAWCFFLVLFILLATIAATTIASMQGTTGNGPMTGIPTLVSLERRDWTVGEQCNVQ
ncbi:unnamed protein product [Discosporangium mesarthrocarpum]